MVNLTDLADLTGAIDSHVEWLLVREAGRTFPLQKSEISLTLKNDRTHFGFLDDHGHHTWRLNEYKFENGEIELDVAGAFARKREKVRLIPRASAAALAADIERARLLIANEIASLIEKNYPQAKVARVSLNTENGRLAQIIFCGIAKAKTAAIADVSETLMPEAILSAAILWLEKLGLRTKDPICDLHIITEKRQAKNLQKLHALLTRRWKSKITIVEIDRKKTPICLAQLRTRQIRDLWREKSKKLVLPKVSEPSETAKKVLDLSPEKIDVVYSKQGETLRFLGLSFARVRVMLGKEKAWFGIDRNKRELTPENWHDLLRLIQELEIYRAAASENTRHELYKMAPEAWLESILRCNIKLLDANLILSPIYNQFRASNDKIDLLALRRDGRLVIIELKTQPDREMLFQAADYWRKIELQRRRGILANANLFNGRVILDRPALIYLVAPALSFQRDYEFFARAIVPEIELWRFELHENWRENIKVLARKSYAADGLTNL